MKAKGGGTTSPRIGQLHGSSVRTSRLEGNQLEVGGWACCSMLLSLPDPPAHTLPAAHKVVHLTGRARAAGRAILTQALGRTAQDAGGGGGRAPFVALGARN